MLMPRLHCSVAACSYIITPPTPLA